MNVLWVDDQQAVSRSLASIVEELGLTITYATDGHMALELLCGRAFDLLILDLKMPPHVWGGLWLLDQLKAQQIKLPTIILSGEGTQSETIKGIRLGADDYVTKDRAELELVQRIQDVCAKYDPAFTLRGLIAAGENDRFECKETLRFHIVQRRFDKIAEHAAMKTVAAFLNTKGGTLVIGVRDDGTVAGMAADGFDSHDRALLHFDNAVKTWLSDVATQYLKVSIIVLPEGDVMKIDCQRSAIPIYTRTINGNDLDFFVRRAASSMKLKIDDAVSYISSHFRDPGPILPEKKTTAEEM